MTEKIAPRPWVAEEATVYDRDGFKVAETDGPHVSKHHDGATHWSASPGVAYREPRWAEEKATAEFIARACNAHDDLVAALMAARLHLMVRPHMRLPEAERNLTAILQAAFELAAAPPPSPEEP